MSLPGLTCIPGMDLCTEMNHDISPLMVPVVMPYVVVPRVDISMVMPLMVIPHVVDHYMVVPVVMPHMVP